MQKGTCVGIEDVARWKDGNKLKLSIAANAAASDNPIVFEVDPAAVPDVLGVAFGRTEGLFAVWITHELRRNAVGIAVSVVL
jgi:hypothetical protein